MGSSAKSVDSFRKCGTGVRSRCAARARISRVRFLCESKPTPGNGAQDGLIDTKNFESIEKGSLTCSVGRFPLRDSLLDVRARLATSLRAELCCRVCEPEANPHACLTMK